MAQLSTDCVGHVSNTFTSFQIKTLKKPGAPEHEKNKKS